MIGPVRIGRTAPPPVGRKYYWEGRRSAPSGMGRLFLSGWEICLTQVVGRAWMLVINLAIDGWASVLHSGCVLL